LTLKNQISHHVFRTFFEGILNKILFGATREEIDNEILEFKKSLKDMILLNIKTNRS
jgi:hypothetical protein